MIRNAIIVTAVADLHSKILDAPPRPNLHFYAVFGKIWPNNRLEPPLPLPLEKSWIHCWIVKR